MSDNIKQIDSIIERHSAKASGLIMILQDIQAHLGYLDPETILRVSEKLGIPKAQVYSVATFYKSFSLKPRGKHKVDICEGTACHIRGASVLMSQVSDELGIKPGETTDDGELTLNSVHCVGACAMAPVAVIDGVYHGSVTASDLKKEIRKCCSDQSSTDAVQEEVDEIPVITERISSQDDFSRLVSKVPSDKVAISILLETVVSCFIVYISCPGIPHTLLPLEQ